MIWIQSDNKRNVDSCMSVIQIYRDKHIHKISGEANVSISIACSLSNCRKGRSLGRRHMHARSTKTTAMWMSAIKRVKMFKHCFLPCPFLSHHLALFQTHVSLILHAAATKHVKMTAKTKKKEKERKKESKNLMKVEHRYLLLVTNLFSWDASKAGELVEGRFKSIFPRRPAMASATAFAFCSFIPPGKRDLPMASLTLLMLLPPALSSLFSDVLIYCSKRWTQAVTKG